MDAVVGLLDGPRAREAFLLRSSFTPPWSLAVRDRAPLTVLVVVRGDAWLCVDGLIAGVGAEAAETGETKDAAAGAGRGVRRLRGGDVALLRGPHPYQLGCDSLSATGEPMAVIGQDQRCSAPDGSAQTVFAPVGLRTWGNSAEGQTQLLTGTYTEVRAVSAALMAALPPVVVLTGECWSTPYPALLAAELLRPSPGQQAVLDRLLDLLLVEALRAWDQRVGASPGRRGVDALVEEALRHLHEQPEQPWTVASLAAQVGLSRASLARRFSVAVGQPPMAYLTQWRLSMAADLLRESDLVLDAIASRVGYSSGFALSAAFTRERGTSPREHRAHAELRAPSSVPA